MSSPSTWPGMTFPFTWGVANDVGRERQQNEDAFALEPEIGLFLVCDGMGGHRGGKLAAHTIAQDLPPAIETHLSQLRGNKPRTLRRLLKKVVATQSQHLHLEGHSESGYRDMGATLVLALLRQGRAYLANLGDSRIYRLRRGRFTQLSRDHSVVAELLEEGTITDEEVHTHEEAGVITRYVGMEQRAQSSIRSFALQKEDRLLLCTDGLTDMVPVAEIRKALLQTTDPQACCDSLITAANRAGGYDNITVLTIHWQG